MISTLLCWANVWMEIEHFWLWVKTIYNTGLSYSRGCSELRSCQWLRFTSNAWVIKVHLFLTLGFERSFLSKTRPNVNTNMMLSIKSIYVPYYKLLVITLQLLENIESVVANINSLLKFVILPCFHEYIEVLTSISNSNHLRNRSLRNWIRSQF